MTISSKRFQIIGQPKLVGWRDGSPKLQIRYRWDGGAVKQRTVTIEKLLAKGDTNTKLSKNSKRNVLTVGLSLSPAQSAGIGNVCPHASAGCESACLDETGLGYVWETIHLARAKRTAAYYLCRAWFIDQLTRELELAQIRADKQGALLAIRLNVFSDIAWERIAPQLFGRFPRAEFYDYTKDPRRVGLLRPNYWVTFSRSETNEADCLRLLADGNNVTVVFDTGMTSNMVARGIGDFELPQTWHGFPVIDGDETDLRFADPRGHKRGRMVGLKLKAVSHVQRESAVLSGFAY